jgi:L-asparaginase
MILPLGGTISMVESAEEKGAKPRLAGADLLRSSAASEDLDFEIASRPPIASANLTLADLVDIVRELERALAGGVHGIVVTLGTDTLEEVAFALDLLLGSERPIVLTGAMRFANQPGAEGPANLKAAIAVASDPAAAGRGVMVVMNDEIHAARFVAKANTISTAAFSSAPFGPLGIVREGRPFWAFRPNARAIPRKPEPRTPQVPVVTPGFGDDGRYLEALIADPPDGVVVAALGAGHVPARLAEMLGRLAGLCPVILASRIAAGPTLERTYGYPGAEIDLLARGLISSGTLSATKAKVALQILLASSQSGAQVKAAFVELQR